MPKPLTMWITINCEKFWKKWEYQTIWPSSWEIYMQIKKQQLEADMEQHTGFKLGKEYFKAIYCHPAYLTYIQSTNLESYDQPRQHIKKQKHYFVNKGLSSQGYGFSSGHVWMWQWTIKKAKHRRIDAFELWWWRRLLRVPWTARRSNQSILKEISPGCSLEGLVLKPKLQYLGHLIRRTWYWEGLRAGEEGDDREWDGWMASPVRWTWVWVDSASWWWTGKPGVLQFMGLQRVGHDWVTELNWTELMQSTSYEMPGWMKHKLESRLPWEISITSDTQMTAPLSQKVKRNLKSLLMKMKEESDKAVLKLSIKKLRSWRLVPSLHVKEMGKQWKQTLFSWGSKSLQMVTAAMKLKDACSFEEKLCQN